MASFSQLVTRYEKTFKGAVNVKYLYLPPKTESDFLIVVFSGFNGKEGAGAKAKYNYGKTLQYVDAHQLYILDDYEGVPCYYLGKNRTADYDTSVASLITQIANQHKLAHRNIIVSGSSKGGTAAVYFAMKYSFGHAVAGGMQTYVGDYIIDKSYTSRHVLPLMTGSNDREAAAYLNSFYFDLFETAETNSFFHIHVGRGDHHYSKHVMPFIKVLERRGLAYDLDVREYNKHSELGIYFADFLSEKIASLINKLFFKDIRVHINGRQVEVTCEVPAFFKQFNPQFALYVYSSDQKEPIKKLMYQNSPVFQLQLNQNGKYRVKVFVKTEKEKVSQNARPFEIKEV